MTKAARKMVVNAILSGDGEVGVAMLAAHYRESMDVAAAAVRAREACGGLRAMHAAGTLDVAAVRF